jgi:1-acyl-sn-glycerol-3-phosphate acyltransferase
MLTLLRSARSLLCVLLVGLLFVLGSAVLRLIVLPANWLFPAQRFRLVSLFMKGMSAGICGLLTLGGARFRRLGSVPTATPVLVVANHQSLLDILQITLMSRPRVPAFVTRSRYRRFVPLVSASVRLLGSPIVDPRRDPRGAVEAVREGARTLPHGILIYPEGHRSTDGEIRPFRTSGIEAILRERRLPVYLVVSDGMWRVRRFADLLFRVHLIDATSRVIGCFEAPARDEDLPAFAQELREALKRALVELRQSQAPA